MSTRFDADSSSQIWDHLNALDDDINAPPPAGLRSGGGSGTQPITTATITKVTLLGTDEGLQGGVTWADDQFTVPKSGIYLVHGRLAWQGNATGLRLLYLRRNNSSPGEINLSIAGSAASHGQTITAPMVLTAGNTVSLYCYQSSGGNLNLINNAGNCGLSVTYLGARP